MLEVCATARQPVAFQGVEYVRIGSYKKKLKDYAEKERELWRLFDQRHFEREMALEHAEAADVLAKLDYPAYFDLLKRPLPEGRDGILEALAADGMIVPGSGGRWNITNLGAILFAKRLADFGALGRKTVRVVQYRGDTKYETIREQEDQKGYACGFKGLIDYIESRLPGNEVIRKAIRREVTMFPIEAVRELVANAIIHQDFGITGTSPMIELFDRRMEIANPGLPLVRTERFLDSPPKSRNEALASFMRRVGICEERGSGIDKVVHLTEAYQLPAPLFETTDEHTRVVLFSHRALAEMDKEDRIRACYQHACLKYVQREDMTNTSLRERFGLATDRSHTASRMITEAIDAKRIKLYDESVGTRARKYLPFWA